MIDQFSGASQDLAQDATRSVAHRAVHERAGAGSPAPDLPGDLSGLEIAVLIPCYNEEASISSVVRDFRAELPGAAIYVYDNNSDLCLRQQL